jgi:hypothetical protein
VTRRGPRLGIAAAVAGFLLVAAAARGHIVYGRPTLLGLVGGADLVAHVRVVDPDATVVVKETGERRPVVRVELREVFKGAGEPGESLRFASHGHGVAEYAKGEEALVFLTPVTRSRELDVLADAGLQWFSSQEHDARYLLTPETRARLLAAVRGYVAAEALSEPEARVKALRGVTLDLLTSGDARLGASAVQDLVLAGPIPLVTAEDVPRLLADVISSPEAPIGVRVGLLAELQRRGLVEGAPLWLALLRNTVKPQLLQVVQAAGHHPNPEVDAALVGMLAGDDDEVAAAAALALGDPAHAGAVEALALALERPEPRVRMAAIRALGRIGTSEAQEVLETLAETHKDPATRRRATAEIRTLARQRGDKSAVSSTTDP